LKVDKAHLRDIAREEAVKQMIRSQNKRYSYLKTKEAMSAKKKGTARGKK